MTTAENDKMVVDRPVLVTQPMIVAGVARLSAFSELDYVGASVLQEIVESVYLVMKAESPNP